MDRRFFRFHEEEHRLLTASHVGLRLHMAPRFARGYLR
jgi:hypothetical protein